MCVCVCARARARVRTRVWITAIGRYKSTQSPPPSDTLVLACADVLALYVTNTHTLTQYVYAEVSKETYYKAKETD